MSKLLLFLSLLSFFCAIFIASLPKDAVWVSTPPSVSKSEASQDISSLLFSEIQESELPSLAKTAISLGEAYAGRETEILIEKALGPLPLEDWVGKAAERAPRRYLVEKEGARYVRFRDFAKDSLAPIGMGSFADKLPSSWGEVQIAKKEPPPFQNSFYFLLALLFIFSTGSFLFALRTIEKVEITFALCGSFLLGALFYPKVSSFLMEGFVGAQEVLSARLFIVAFLVFLFISLAPLLLQKVLQKSKNKDKIINSEYRKALEIPFFILLLFLFLASTSSLVFSAIVFQAFFFMYLTGFSWNFLR